MAARKEKHAGSSGIGIAACNVDGRNHLGCPYHHYGGRRTNDCHRCGALSTE